MEKRELDLWKLAKRGERWAINRLFHCHLGLVHQIARRNAAQWADHDDLIQAGSLGLLQAIKRFNPKRGIQFSTYAAYWINVKIYRAKNEAFRLIRIPESSQTMLYKWMNGKLPDGSISKTQRKTLQAAYNAKMQVSLDALVSNKDEEGKPFLELVSDPTDQNILEKAETKELLDKAINGLDGRMADIIRWRFGIGGREPMTREDVAHRMRLSRERVRQLEERGLRYIKKVLTHGSGIKYKNQWYYGGKMTIDLTDVIEMLISKRDDLDAAIRALSGISSPSERKDWTRKRYARKAKKEADLGVPKDDRAKKLEYQRQWYARNKEKLAAKKKAKKNQEDLSAAG